MFTWVSVSCDCRCGCVSGTQVYYGEVEYMETDLVRKGWSVSNCVDVCPRCNEGLCPASAQLLLPRVPMGRVTAVAT